ncbi:MAG: SusC/RagA family TonB-linked outer membrane protein [Paludibacter sp. 47-17]|nr:MAG: SusC/RagA family TonB-linked outer membrane protein [Paludibacter sp. SCN 50-10]ODU61934.1 MAG: SusC/RagA family TonB-linked outer membrane protein [Paludibacter sp. SCN 51-9]OJX90963.1 MAG: SusC/RagA family TonB-linked outer membrane protein [Paludibacter sp. 47-17]
MLLLTLPLTAQNQQITVKAKVVDEKSEPVIGATVKVEGTTAGTVTDLSGSFQIKAASNQTVSISYIGYVTQKFRAGQVPVVITLQEETEKLDELVVVGYGAVKRANLTGAVANIDMKEVADIPAPNLASVLMGTMPGVKVGEATGNVVGNSTIQIRINGSWNSEEPLFVIDGFIRDLNAFNMLDPSEIENISVLKDAAAAIYGVRGAGGVLLVTTKKGKAGKTRVSYSTSYGINQGVNMPEMMSAYEQGMALNDLWQQEITYKGETADSKRFFTADELNAMKNMDYNWLEMGWKNSGNMRHTLNISGGNDDVRYFIGGSYMWADGNFANLNMNRYGLRVGVDAKMARNLNASFGMNYNDKSTEMPLNQRDSEPERMYGTFSDLARAPRFTPAYINGIPVGNSIPSNGSHPLEMMNSGSYRRNKSNDMSASLSLEYTVEKIKGLKFKVSGSFSNGSNFGKQLSKPYYIYDFIPLNDQSPLLSEQQYPIGTPQYQRKISNGDKIYESSSRSYNYQLNPEVSYANKFGKHDLSTLLMFELSESGGNGMSLSRQNVIIENYEVMAGYASSAQTTASNINTKSRRQSLIGRLNYNYDNRYFIESATRYEASTNFAPGYRWGLFPSISGGWRISEEDFFKESITFMDNLKLRASYGRLGNDKVSMNQWRSSYGTIPDAAYVGGSALSSVLFPTMEGLFILNSTWEKTDSYNAGIDMRLFGDFSVNIDGFYRHTFDILDDYKSAFPQSSGINAATPKLNYGVQDSWGGELELGYNKKLTKDFTLQLKGNIAYATNIVLKKWQNPGNIGTWEDEVGRIRGGEVGYFSYGIARTQEELDNWIAELKSHIPLDENGNPKYTEITVLDIPESALKPGMLMFKDVGGPRYQDADGNWHDGAPDGKITTEDRRIISKYDSAPFTYGFTLGFTWKDIKVDAIFSGAFGNDVVFEKGFYENASGGSRSGDFLSAQSNQLREWYGNYWTESNPDAKYPRLDTYSLRNQRSTFWMRDGHNLRLRSLNMSYNVPKNLTKSLGVDQLRVFFSGTNLLTLINPYPYKDASVGFWSDYPMIRTFNFGLNLNF